MKLSLKILIQAIFWIVFQSINTIDAYRMYDEGIHFSKLLHIAINTLWAATIFYVFYFYFIRFFEKAKFVKYLIFSIISSITVTFIFLPIHKLFYSNFVILNYITFGPPLVGTFLLAQCGTLVRGFENWIDNIKLKAELESRNLKNELDLLKSQVNPHFLFNTLNNIDTLIYKSPADASKSLLTLSDMLRYMIYDTNVSMVELNKEIEHLRRYIDLQKLRMRDSSFLKAQFPADCNKAQIAPMLLLPFVENAFKFVSNKSEFPAIDIHIECSESHIYFTCKNNYSINETTRIHSGGVGLENVKRRLELIYANKYTLNISKENNIFDVQLKLELN